jgi:hypothetical protein
MHPIDTIIRVARHGPAMTRRRFRDVRRNIVLCLGAALAAVVALAPPAGAASWASPRVARAQLARTSELSLSQAPAGLRAAVRRTLGVRNGPLSRASKPTKLTGPAGFGGSVAIYGSTAVVGAPAGFSKPGVAYVFVRSGTTWKRQAKLTASHSAVGDLFGESVGIYKSTVVVGAEDAGVGRGAAYVFVRSGTTWSQQAKLTGSHGAGKEHFGRSVAIYKSTVVVGAPFKHFATGAAYVFVRAGTTWSRQGELTASDGAQNDLFGNRLAMDGSTVMVAACCDHTQAAYVFVRSGTAWSQQAELTDPPAADENFGWSLAISGSTAVVGAPLANSRTGAAYVFLRSGTTWSLQATLTASAGAAGDWFGFSAAIYGSTAVVGAPFKNSNAGAAYVFARVGTAWSQQAELTGAAKDVFGGSVSMYGSTAVVGAAGVFRSKTGAAYVFTGL